MKRGAGLVMAIAGALVAAACSSGSSASDDAGAGSSTSSTATSTVTTASTTTLPPTTTTTLPPLPDDGVARALVTPRGVVVAVVRAEADGSHVVVSPCGREVRVRGGTPISGAHVVLDPGHGGSEDGAEGPTGLREADVNLAVANAAKAELDRLGIETVLTRTDDYRITLASRAAIATNLGADAFVSIHHNAEPTHLQDTPGSEVYYQVTGGEASKRLGGLVYEEVVAALAPYDIEWAAFREAQVKVRLNSEGGDYYGILRRSEGVPAVLAELAYITNPPEEALLRTPEFQAVEGNAIARALLRYLTTDDPGTGFVGPSDRSAPAGPGGGSQGCEDPPLG